MCVCLCVCTHNKTGICISNMVPGKEKACVEIGKNTENSNLDGVRFGNP